MRELEIYRQAVRAAEAPSRPPDAPSAPAAGSAAARRAASEASAKQLAEMKTALESLRRVADTLRADNEVLRKRATRAEAAVKRAAEGGETAGAGERPRSAAQRVSALLRAAARCGTALQQIAPMSPGTPRQRAVRSSFSRRPSARTAHPRSRQPAGAAPSSATDARTPAELRAANAQLQAALAEARTKASAARDAHARLMSEVRARASHAPSKRHTLPGNCCGCRAPRIADALCDGTHLV